jgi:hypothetical protein
MVDQRLLSYLHPIHVSRQLSYSLIVSFFSRTFNSCIIAIAAQLYEDHDFVKSVNVSSSNANNEGKKDMSGRLMLMMR